MKLFLLFLLGTCAGKWFIMIKSRRKGVYNPDNEQTVTYQKHFDNVALLYTFPGVTARTFKHCIKCISDHYTLFKVMGRQRAGATSVSLLQQLFEEHPRTFSRLSSAALILSISMKKDETVPPFVDLSTLGNTDYAMYEVSEEGIKLRQSSAPGMLNFAPQPCHAQLSDRNVVEIRFQPTQMTYLVLGCPVFWTVMGAEEITSLLKSSIFVDELADNITHAACVKLLMNTGGARSTIEAAGFCRDNIVKGLSSSIACMVVELKEFKASTTDSQDEELLWGYESEGISSRKRSKHRDRSSPPERLQRKRGRRGLDFKN